MDSPPSSLHKDDHIQIHTTDSRRELHSLVPQQIYFCIPGLWIKSEARGHADWDGNVFTTSVTLSRSTRWDLLLRRYSHSWDRKPLPSQPPQLFSVCLLSFFLAWPTRASAKKHILSVAGLCQEIIHLYNYGSTKGNLYSIWLQVKDAYESITPIHLFLWN